MATINKATNIELTGEDFAAKAWEVRLVVRSACQKARIDHEDMVADFVVAMLERQWWRRYDPARGNVEGFVVQWLLRFAANRIDRKIKRDMLAARTRERMSRERRTSVASTSGSEIIAAQTWSTICSAISPEQGDVLRAFIACNGKAGAAAVSLDQPPSSVYSTMLSVRARLARRGIDRTIVHRGS